MQSVEIAPDAPILPDEGLGGLRLRTHIKKMQHTLLSRFIRSLPGTEWYRLTRPFEAVYRLEMVEIAVDVRNGKICRLSAYDGYRGMLFGSIIVGMKAGKAMSLDPRLYYDEANEMLLFREVEGVAMNVSEVDPDPSAVPTYAIKSISVFPREILTDRGMDGRW